jgi:sensor domain CHASE-containing protein
MTETQTIALLITAIAGLVTAVVYLYKRGEKREKEMQQLVKDALNTIRSNETVINNTTGALTKVEALLKNWRAH